MKRKIQKRILQSSYVIEIIIAILLIGVTGVLTLNLVVDVKNMILSGQGISGFDGFLEVVLNLVVGIEFIKMLCEHTPDAVIEVLVFAIARQMIVEHTSNFENLAGIISIAILFIVRRYLLRAKIKDDESLEEKDI
ncbi:MAG: transporter [Clostridium sp.]|nr:transporter [Clostridium sp.]